MTSWEEKQKRNWSSICISALSFTTLSTIFSAAWVACKQDMILGMHIVSQSCHSRRVPSKRSSSLTIRTVDCSLWRIQMKVRCSNRTCHLLIIWSMLQADTTIIGPRRRCCFTQQITANWHFYRATHMQRICIARYGLVSVCPSFTIRCSIETAEWIELVFDTLLSAYSILYYKGILQQ